MLVHLDKVGKYYKFKGKKNQVLLNLDLNVQEGDFVAIQGKSGSGKTTLLNIISGIIAPTSGLMYFAGKKIGHLFDFMISAYRSENIGFVFQNFNLIAYQSVLENVMAPLNFSSKSPIKHKALALEALEAVGIYEKRFYYPNLLSGGQMQRVAIARALVKNPKLIIADEPTGNLDMKTAGEITEMFLKFNQEKHITFIIVTHSRDIVKQANQAYELREGKLFPILNSQDSVTVGA